MKTYTLLLASLMALIQSCGNSDNEIPKGDCLTLLIDRTDTLKASSELKTEDFIPLLQVSSNPLASANVCLAPITNIRFERTYSVTIPETDKYSVNELDRKAQIDSFKSQISSLLNLIHKSPCGINGSAIFESIAIKLNDLALCNVGSTKRLIVISDLLENTSWFNAYHSEELAEFVENPKRLYKKLDKQCPIKHSIKGITINFIYQPKSVIDDDQFYKISGLIKDYLENKGAKVFISASLNN